MPALPPPPCAYAACLAEVTVVAGAPLPGTGVDADKLPGEVQSLSIGDLARDRPIDVLPNLVGARLASVSLNDEQGSPFQPDFVFRGFEASPVSGVAQGIAVYQDGVRLNESFGDTVNWDLVPLFAVQRFTVQSNNPVFGLNSLGGVVALTMKDGLGFQGADGEVSGGAFGKVSGEEQFGARFGDYGAYLGVGGLRDDGFRYHSQATLRQAYGDLAYDRGRWDWRLSLSGALNDIAAVGPTPVQMLAADPRSVFTFPQATRNGLETIQLRGGYRANAWLSLDASVYYRRFRQSLTDGNTTNVRYCANAPSRLCLEGTGSFPGDALYGSGGAPVPANVLPAGATPGELDFIGTRTDSLGGTAQASLSAPVLGHANSLSVGASIDVGFTAYAAHAELGVLGPDLRVVGVGVTIDQRLSPTAQPPLQEAVSLAARNRYAGLYAIDVLDLTARLSWTLSGRLNVADIRLSDRLGEALNADHGFQRFNPGTGLTYKLTPRLTAYAGYSESNRAPTAAELSCADPSSPCPLGAFLVADPALMQVVSRNIEAGLRGRFGLGAAGTVTWNASIYRTISDNDIMLLATSINGFGYFQNAGAIWRQGVDLRLDYQDPRWAVSASYTYLDASFRDALTVSSNSPAADANGFIRVRPGATPPMTPADRLTLTFDYAATPAWRLGGDLRAQSGQYLAGDPSNQEPKLPGFATLNLRTSYRLGPRVTLFGEIENLFDRRYYTYGAFTQLGELPPSLSLSDPRTYSPAEGRNLSIGARVRSD